MFIYVQKFIVNIFSLQPIEIQVVRQFRTNFSVNSVTKEQNETKKRDKDGPITTSSSSDSDLDDDSDTEGKLFIVNVNNQQKPIKMYQFFFVLYFIYRVVRVLIGKIRQ